MEKLSIVIPIYNAEKYLVRCLESIINQTLIDIEIILVNDGSTDSSLNICLEYEKKDKRIKVIDKKNEGVSIARNVGISVAKSDYIAFLDPDDEIDKNMYKDMYTSTIKNSVEICFCNYKIVNNGQIQDIVLPFKQGYYQKEELNKLILEMIGGETLYSSNVMGCIWRSIFKKEIINKYNIIFPPNIRPMQDLIFIIEYMSKCRNMYVLDNCYYYYYVNTDSAITGYKKNVWENFIKVYQLITEKLEKSGIMEEARPRLDNRLVELGISSIGNEAHFNNKEKYRNKIKNIEDILMDKTLDKAMASISQGNRALSKVFILYCIKYKNSKMLYLYFRLNNYLKLIRKGR